MLSYAVRDLQSRTFYCQHLQSGLGKEIGSAAAKGGLQIRSQVLPDYKSGRADRYDRKKLK
jgi:hypothetical protein